MPHATIDKTHLAGLLTAEIETYGRDHPRSLELSQRGARVMYAGVPMPWMTMWAGDFPLYFESASGARLIDVDGREYIDFCLGDSAALAGHSPSAVAEVVSRRAASGITAMLPTDDSIWVAEELGRRFGLPTWQFTLSATDANRNAIRFARHVTGRPKVLVFNYAYHGTVDDALVSLIDGQIRPKRWALGVVVDPSLTSRVVEFNDLGELERALANDDVACVLAEPALTNIGIVLPEPGYHEELRRLTSERGVLLVIDETHTICAGAGGATGAYQLEPDMLVMGKWLGSGIPGAALGVTGSLADQITDSLAGPLRGPSGVGGTVAGNALSLAAMQATLKHVLTADAFSSMIDAADRWRAGVEEVISVARLPWHVAQLGCRGEYRYRAEPPANGAEAALAIDPELDRYMHLASLNRGVLMTPFHSMALMSPAHTHADVDRHTAVFEELVSALDGAG